MKPIDKFGRIIDDHAMCWFRQLNAPVDQVWEVVATKEGLLKWWVAPPKLFDLKVGGVFSHHWDNEITDYDLMKYIDFKESLGPFKVTGGMMFELESISKSTTKFMFLDTFGLDAPVEGINSPYNVQPGGSGTIIPSIPAGWNCAIDELEKLFNEEASFNNEMELNEIYLEIISNHFRIKKMVSKN